jgi:hypothetical protein
MRPVVEHAIRTGYFKQTLEIPFSLFLENIWNKQYTVISVNKIDGDCLSVRHWDIVNLNKHQDLPSYEETVIPGEDLFNSDAVILDGYKTLHYLFEDYQSQLEPEGSDSEQWGEEEQTEYSHIMERLFFSINHQMRREEILWHNFMNCFLNKSYNMYLRGSPIDMQQSIVQEANSVFWNNWMLWRMEILDFNGKIAPELAFLEFYEKKLRENEKYQEKLREDAIKAEADMHIYSAFSTSTGVCLPF